MSQPNSQIPKDNHEIVETTNPATGEVHQTYTMHTADEMHEIIEGAHEAYLSWRKTSMEERAAIMNKTAEIVERDKQMLGEMMAKQMGGQSPFGGPGGMGNQNPFGQQQSPFGQQQNPFGDAFKQHTTIDGTAKNIPKDVKKITKSANDE